MHHFFVDKSEIIGDDIKLYGDDFHHLQKVLRGKIGEEIIISDGDAVDYHCKIKGYEEDHALLSISFLEEMQRKRWQSIAEAAAKQSKRSIIPEVLPVTTWKEAFSTLKDAEMKLLPYENERGVGFTKEVLQQVEELGGKAGSKIVLCIGPEGGFSIQEVEEAKKEGFLPISLGKRILRTETAAIAALSLLMMHLEFAENKEAE